MRGVPVDVNLGTPIRQDGMVISRWGKELGGSISSVVRGRCFDSSPGLDMTTLKAPASDSLMPVSSRMVLSDKARRCLVGGLL